MKTMQRTMVLKKAEITQKERTGNDFFNGITGSSMTLNAYSFPDEARIDLVSCDSNTDARVLDIAG